MEKNKLNFFREKFIWLVVIFSLFCIGILGWIMYYHSSQMNTIVQEHKHYVQSQEEFLKEIKINKSVMYLNDNVLKCVEIETKKVEDMLQLQTTYQHAQFTLLSVWSGVLMIVFLIFSLYSMFKTDELIKQARESINTIGNSKMEVDEKIQDAKKKITDEVEDIKATSNEYLGKIKSDLEKEQSIVSENIKLKSDEFSRTFLEYGNKLAEAQKTLDGIFKGIEVVVNAVRSTGTSTIETIENQNKLKK